MLLRTNFSEEIRLHQQLKNNERKNICVYTSGLGIPKKRKINMDLNSQDFELDAR